jgi:cysteine desulfurase family protein
MMRYLNEIGANPGRAGHRAATEAQSLIDAARRKLAALFGVDDAERIVFCLNCTDALNMAIKGTLAEGDHVVTTDLEHNSVSRPLRALAEANVIQVTSVPASADGYVDPDAVVAAIRPNTRLVVCTHASNVLGTIQPVEEIGRGARERGVWFLLDAAQTAGTVPISVEQLCVDMLAFPGHKSLLGPPGTGGLYVGPRVTIRPWREGGTGGDSTSPTQPIDMPFWLEAGTPNTVGIIGLGAALEVLDPAANLAHERAMLARLIAAAEEHPRIRVVGDSSANHRVGTISLVLTDLLPEEASAILDEAFAIATRGGLHCAPNTHRAVGTFPEGTLRVSPGPFTPPEDIDALTSALRKITTC